MRMPRIKLPRSKFADRVVSRVRTVAAPVASRLGPVANWVLPWRRPRRERPAPIMKPYVDQTRFRRKVAAAVFPIGLGLFCLIYGFFFALTAPYLLVPFAFPVGILMLMAIWALPDRPHAPTKTMEFFFAGLIVSLIIWPNYLALALPGLPWITVIRLTGFPMTFLLLICLSTSASFRSELRQSLRSVPGLWAAFIVFTAMQFLTLGFSKSIPSSIQRALLQQVNWTAVFVVCAWIFRKPGRAERYVALFVLLSLPVILVTVLESRQQKLLWTGHVPSFLKIDDPTAAAAMTGSVRGATGQYRAKATFSGPLGLGEYLAMMTPFCIHIALGAYRPILRIGAAVLVPAIFMCFILADSRLGIVGFLVSVLLYGLFWGLIKMRRERGSILAATVVYAYPAVFAMAMVGVMFVGKLHRMVFGGGAQAASNAARQNQIHMAIPRFFENPFGHGASQSGTALGYSADSFVTVDNYYISLALEYGIIGISAFLAIFGTAIVFGARSAMTPVALRDRELSLLAPLTIALSAFLVIKGVFSQQDGHPLVFAMLGMVVALAYRVSVAMQAEAQPQPDAASGSPPSKITARLPSGNRLPQPRLTPVNARRR